MNEQIEKLGFVLGNRGCGKTATIDLVYETRKETAREIFNTIIKALETKKASVTAHYGVKESVGADVSIRTVKELAKEYGVEVKE